MHKMILFCNITVTNSKGLFDRKIVFVSRIANTLLRPC